MWCKCVSKHGICDINTIINIKDSFSIAEMSHIQLYTYTFAPHLNNSKYNVNPKYYAVNTQGRFQTARRIDGSTYPHPYIDGSTCPHPYTDGSTCPHPYTDGSTCPQPYIDGITCPHHIQMEVPAPIPIQMEVPAPIHTQMEVPVPILYRWKYLSPSIHRWKYLSPSLYRWKYMYLAGLSSQLAGVPHFAVRQCIVRYV